MEFVFSLICFLKALSLDTKSSASLSIFLTLSFSVPLKWCKSLLICVPCRICRRWRRTQVAIRLLLQVSSSSVNYELLKGPTLTLKRSPQPISTAAGSPRKPGKLPAKGPTQAVCDSLLSLDVCDLPALAGESAATDRYGRITAAQAIVSFSTAYVSCVTKAFVFSQG